jgi:hypothetical protein
MAAHELARWHIPTQTSIVLVLREDISGRERERKQHLSQSHEPKVEEYPTISMTLSIYFYINSF